MKKLITKIAIAVFVSTLLVSCGSGGLNGTYVAKNDAAKQSMYTKFIFKGGRVKVVMGTMGIEMPGGYEYGFSREGDKVKIEMSEGGISMGGIDLNYNEKTDELRLLFGGELGAALNDHAPTWGKEGTFDPNDPYAAVDNSKEKPTVNSPFEKNTEDGSNNWGSFFDRLFGNNDKDKSKNNEEQISNTQSDEEGNSWNYHPNVFYQELAMTCAIYSEKVYNMGRIQEGLKIDGYTAFEYNYNTDENGIGFALAYKALNDNEILLAVVIRGTTGNEWFGNMDIGENSVRHESFQQANYELQQTINDYINKYTLNNINFLVTGHSRGGAVANLLAVDLNNMTFIKNATTKKVHAYTFATPNNRKDFNDKAYDNIFNFCFVDDFVTGVPLEKWGYGKSGKTYLAVAEGLSYVNEDFKNFAKSNNLEFNHAATADVIRDIYEITNTVERYYNKKLAMVPIDFPGGEENMPLHRFMREYIAQAKIDGENGLTKDNSPAIKNFGKKAFFDTGNDVHKIAIYFIEGENNDENNPLRVRKSVNDSHDMKTYYNALRTNGFLTE